MKYITWSTILERDLTIKSLNYEIEEKWWIKDALKNASLLLEAAEMAQDVFKATRDHLKQNELECENLRTMNQRLSTHLEEVGNNSLNKYKE